MLKCICCMLTALHVMLVQAVQKVQVITMRDTNEPYRPLRSLHNLTQLNSPMWELTLSTATQATQRERFKAQKKAAHAPRTSAAPKEAASPSRRGVAPWWGRRASWAACRLIMAPGERRSRRGVLAAGTGLGGLVMQELIWADS